MVDLNKLSMGSLRRYQSWFKMDIPTTVRDKAGVLEYVQKHFDNVQVDPETVVSNFLKIKKDAKPEDHFLRKSARHKEKQEKRIGPGAVKKFP